MEIIPGEEAKVLADIRSLLWEVVLPRLDDLDCQMRLLRAVTWPVCQSIRERHTLDDLENKRRFLKDGVSDLEEATRLLKKKWTLEATRPVEFSGRANHAEEFTRTSWKPPLDHFRPCREPDHQTSGAESTQSSL